MSLAKSLRVPLFNSRVTICDDSIQPDLMKIRGLKLQHLMYAFLVNLVRRRANLFCCTIRAAKSRGDEPLAVFVQKVESVEMGACRDFDQLRETIPDLRSGEGAQKGEIEEGVHRCMIGTEAVLIIAIIDSNLDRH